MRKDLKIIKLLLNIGNFRPGWYLYLGRHFNDRDLSVLGWKGPFKSRKKARHNIPDWWNVAGIGIDRPKICFRLFEPYQQWSRGRIQ